MEIKKTIPCIIDTDPGVDDSAALALSLYDDVMDIKLVTTVRGNLGIDIVTRNALHLLEKFGRPDIPLAKGSADTMHGHDAPDASYIHQGSGMGGYTPPEVTTKQPIDKDVVEAMYEEVVKNKGEIVIIALGPHTNVGKLIAKHPDVVGMIKHIYCEGCAPYGKITGSRWDNYVSFNVSTDPDAFKIVINSGIPITIVPSMMGRELANFTEEQVMQIRDINDTGRFIYEMYNGYWEHNYPDRRIATNDSLATLIFRFPKIFKSKKCFISVDTDEILGRTFIEFNKRGNINYVYKVNRKKMHKAYFNAVRKMSRFKFYN